VIKVKKLRIQVAKTKRAYHKLLEKEQKKVTDNAPIQDERFDPFLEDEEEPAMAEVCSC
jgi:hypothetical protein